MLPLPFDIWFFLEAVLKVDTKFPWYDSPWMNRYVASREYLAAHNPAKLETFDAAMDKLRTDPDFEVIEIENFLDPADHEAALAVIRETSKQQFEMHELKQFGRLVIHDHEVFNDLQARMTAKVSSLVGEEVEPCYNFLSLYWAMGVCPVHMDAPQAKWTVDICIDQSDIWPIHFSKIIPWPDPPEEMSETWQEDIKNDPDLGFRSYELKPRNAIIFSGSSQYHYRDRITGVAPGKNAFCNLVFLHYVPKGTNAYSKPDDWAEYFGVPELVFD